MKFRRGIDSLNNLRVLADSRIFVHSHGFKHFNKRNIIFLKKKYQKHFRPVDHIEKKIVVHNKLENVTEKLVLIPK